ncbi:MAG: hypothetical protein LDLANPLL_00766 [Turneriella sp.]|nr:hypothetical protein [Turneriella sp.]
MSEGQQTVVRNKIKEHIYTIRDQQVMLDEEFAELYGVETRILNQAVKRNAERFPQEFMFQLTDNELEILGLSNRPLTRLLNNLKRRKLAYFACYARKISVKFTLFRQSQVLSMAVEDIYPMLLLSKALRCFQRY